jgi:hypothetical protein
MGFNKDDLVRDVETGRVAVVTKVVCNLGYYDATLPNGSTLHFTNQANINRIGRVTKWKPKTTER